MSPPDETSRLRPTRRPWSSLRNLKCRSAGTTLIWYSSSSVVGPSPTPPSTPPPLPELDAIVCVCVREREAPLLCRRWISPAQRSEARTSLGAMEQSGRRRQSGDVAIFQLTPSKHQILYLLDVALARKLEMLAKIHFVNWFHQSI